MAATAGIAAIGRATAQRPQGVGSRPSLTGHKLSFALETCHPKSGRQQMASFELGAIRGLVAS